MTLKTKFTYADYLALPGDERYELHDGELILVASPNEPHQRASKMLFLQIAEVEASGLGQAYFAPFDIVFSDTEVVQPDLMFIARERAEIITHANVQAAPDLVVEILSPSTASRDWNYKQGLYAKYGVKELWIVDPEAAFLWRLMLRGDAFEIAGVYGAGESFDSPTLGGFTINLTDVF